MEPILDALTAQSVVIVAGKGGVGKTTVTAALAFAAAASGRSVLAVELDGKPQLAAWLQGIERVDTTTIAPGRALEEYLADHGFGRAAKRLSNSGVIDLLAAATPGINDVVVLGKIKQIERGGAYDLVIVDGPAAGHAISMLTSARGLIEIARGGPIRRQADEVDELLTDRERCGVVLVTLPETTPVNELVETAFDVEERAQVTLNGIVVNQVMTAPPLTDAEFATIAGDGHRDDPDPGGPDRIIGVADAARFIADRRRVQDRAFARLDDELPLTRWEVPLVATADLVGDDIASLGVTALGASYVAPPTKTRSKSVSRSSADDPPDTNRGSAHLIGADRSVGTALADVIEERDVLLCVGSGGVGKTTTAAALGLGAAQRGRRVVVVTIDPARRLADALGMPNGLTDEPTRVEALPADRPSSDVAVGELWAMMLNPTAMLRRVVERYASDAEQVERIVENRLFQQLATSLSGTQEYMATEALYELANDDRFDLVIVDTPPSRQTLTFLESPGLLSRFLSHRLFRLMMLPTRSSLKIVGDASQALLRQVGKVVGSDVLADATAFFQAFAGMDEGFRERAEAVDGVLRSPTTGFVLAAGPNADTVAEAMWFAQRLRELNVEVSATIINRLIPAVEQGLPARPDGTSSPDASTALAANLDQMATMAAAQRRAIAPLLTSAPSVTQVPLLGSDVHNQAALAVLADQLFGSQPTG